MNPRVASIAVAFAAALVAVAWLRVNTGSDGVAGSLAEYATLLYIGAAVCAAVLFRRAGVPLRQFGFGPPIRPMLFIGLGILGVALLQANGAFLGPIWETLLGGGRDLSRFDAVAGSTAELVRVLVLSWTVAAVGEELTFRILLMRGIAHALGDSRVAFAFALVAQAVIFGLVHAYQGPTGVVGTFTSGLIYGALTLAARGSIWPAALAHGLNNTIGLVSLYQGG